MHKNIYAQQIHIKQFSYIKVCNKKMIEVNDLPGGSILPTKI